MKCIKIPIVKLRTCHNIYTRDLKITARLDGYFFYYKGMFMRIDNIENYHMEDGELIGESDYDIADTPMVKITDHLNDITRCDIKAFDVIGTDDALIVHVKF